MVGVVVIMGIILGVDGDTLGRGTGEREKGFGDGGVRSFFWEGHGETPREKKAIKNTFVLQRFPFQFI